MNYIPDKDIGVYVMVVIWLSDFCDSSLMCRGLVYAFIRLPFYPAIISFLTHIISPTTTHKNALKTEIILLVTKGAFTWYRKLTWESVHAWNFITLCLLLVWGITYIFIVHLSFTQSHC